MCLLAYSKLQELYDRSLSIIPFVALCPFNRHAALPSPTLLPYSTVSTYNMPAEFSRRDILHASSEPSSPWSKSPLDHMLNWSSARGLMHADGHSCCGIGAQLAADTKQTKSGHKFRNQVCTFVSVLCLRFEDTCYMRRDPPRCPWFSTGERKCCRTRMRKNKVRSIEKGTAPGSLENRALSAAMIRQDERQN